jgi:hypothetical protein
VRPEFLFVHSFDWQVTAAAGPSNPSAPAAAHTGFVVASGLAAVFAALNLKPDVHARSLACTAQWLDYIGVRYE